MKDEYIYKVKDVCCKCGGSGIDYSKIFSDDYCSRRLCRVCKGKGYTVRSMQIEDQKYI